MLKVEKAYLEHTSTAQPPQSDPKCSYRVIGLDRWQQQHVQIKIEPRKLKIEHLNDKRGQIGKKTHLGHGHIVQPPRNPLKCHYGVIGLRCQCGCIKPGPTNISQMWNSRSTYLGRVYMIWSTRRPKKRIKRLNELTFSSRM